MNDADGSQEYGEEVDFTTGTNVELIPSFTVHEDDDDDDDIQSTSCYISFAQHIYTRLSPVLLVDS